MEYWKINSKSTEVKSTLSIPAHKSGKLQPKAQMTVFNKYYETTTPQCREDVHHEGSLKGITSVPFFASCIGSSTGLSSALSSDDRNSNGSEHGPASVS